MKKILFILFLFLMQANVFAQTKGKTENVILITFDGCRWKDVFEGADSALLYSAKFKKSDSKRLIPKLGAKTVSLC